MNKVKDAKDDISFYIENTEYIANSYVLRCVSITMLIYSFVFLLNVIGVFVIEQSLMWRAYIPSLVIYLIICFVSKRVSLSDEKTKYFILFFTIVIFTVTGVFVTYHVVLLSILPFLYATLYSSKRVMSFVYVLTVISTFIVVYGGYFWGLCDANMTLLTYTNMDGHMQNGQFILTEINPNPLITLMLYYAVPRCLVYIAFVFVCNDIYKLVCGSVERAKLSDELQKAKDAAENANRAKTQFLTRMSHEIRTPINAVLGMNEMILRESNENETRKYAKDIRNSASALLSLVNDILDTSKIESGKMNIVPVNYQMSSLLNDLYNMLSIKAKQKGLCLEFDIDPNIPLELCGDDIRIRQVLVNLLTNAVKYTEEGIVTLTVCCEVLGDDAILHWSVKDTGIGIKDEDLDKLFDQFERFEETKNRNIEGTGLGLNISLQLLDLMDSELKVVSEYGIGSEFYFDIVQEIVNPQPLGIFQTQIQNVAHEESDVNYKAPNAKVLVVDDNEINRNVFRNLLKRTEIKVYEARSGEECLEILENQQFDIIFLDYMMPIMDGVETLHRIKSKGICENTPIVMLTANAIVGAKEEYLKEGFDDYITKPIIPEKLDKLIIEYLSKELVIRDKVDYIQNEEVDKLPQLEEFDFQYALKILKSEELLLKTLKDFYYALEELPKKITPLLDDIDVEEIRKNYKIEVHTLKGNSATVGAILLSKLARMLEVASLENDVERIRILHPILLDEVKKHKERIAQIIPELKNKLELKCMEDVVPYFDLLKNSLKQNDYDTADAVCDEIRKYNYPEEIQPVVDGITEGVMNFETEQTILAIEKLIKNINDEKECIGE